MNVDQIQDIMTKSIEDESFVVEQFGESIELIEIGVIIDGTLTVTDVDSSNDYTSGSDYEVDTENGTITVLESGSMTEGEEYLFSLDKERDEDEINFMTVGQNDIHARSADLTFDDSNEFVIEVHSSGQTVYWNYSSIDSISIRSNYA